MKCPQCNAKQTRLSEKPTGRDKICYECGTEQWRDSNKLIFQTKHCLRKRNRYLESENERLRKQLTERKTYDAK